MWQEDCVLQTVQQGWQNDTVEDTYLGTDLDLALEPQDARQGLECY